MKNKKLLLAAVALVALVGILAGVWFATRPEAQEGMKTFTVTVVHGSGEAKDFTYTTDAEYLGAFLYEEGLLVADENNPGMFHTADGEKADWNENQSYWGFYIGDEYATEGVETTLITDGAVYKLVYTVWTQS